MGRAGTQCGAPGQETSSKNQGKQEMTAYAIGHGLTPVQ